MPETMNFLRSTEMKNENENRENMCYLKITTIVIVILSKIIINKIQMCAFVPNKSFCQLFDFSPKIFFIFKNF